ncbi:hypothetical protein ACFR9U_20195 [Halorientalis brevis]|uniref:Uncharacterized protein n=1 Tax=Halorientalis brevis TaxID=1126241 RepID=A0ABD6CGE6_9EURY|nr:hypothetical protein [Halorientalis brevis]
MWDSLEPILLGEHWRAILLFVGLAIIAVGLTYDLAELLDVLGVSPTEPAWIILLGGIMLILRRDGTER